MKTCDTCRWWGNTDRENSYFADPGSGFRRCNCPRVAYNRSMVHGGGDVFAKNALAYGDYEGYAATVATGPKFGCVLHEDSQKEPV